MNAGPRPVTPSMAGLDGPAVEQQLAGDMIKRALFVVPVLVAVGALGWGAKGAASVALAVALVCANFALAAALLSWTARISLALMMVAALGGYLVRLGLILVVVLAVRHQPWVSLVPLGLALIVTHLGLLAWETRYVSASLAFPGLRPRPASQKG